MANEINVLGVLNAITVDSTIARAEQVEFTCDDGTKAKIPSELVKHIKGLSSLELIDFTNANADETTRIKDNRLFICTSSTNDTYVTGHIYYYTGSDGAITDITPATGGGSDSSAINLSVSFTSTTILSDTSFKIPFTWTSVNSGFGYVYCLIDGSLDKKIRMSPGTSNWEIAGLSRGAHSLMMYVIDSAGVTSKSWKPSLTIGSLELSSTFDDSKIYQLGADIIIQYSAYSIDDSELKLIVNVDSGTDVEEDISSSYTFTGIAGNHVVTMKIKATTSTGTVKYSNILTYNILIAAPGVLYATAVGSTTISAKEREKVDLQVRATYIVAKSFSASLTAYKAVINESTQEETWVADPTEYATPSTWYNGINNFIITSLPVGKWKLIVEVSYAATSGTITKTVTFIVTIETSDLLHISQIVDDSLLLHLSAVGKTNNDENRKDWVDTSATA